MALVTIDDIEMLYGPVTDPVQRARAVLDIEAVTETLEGWLRRKLTDDLIVDEPHTITDRGIFFFWGEPQWPVAVRAAAPVGAYSHLLYGVHDFGTFPYGGKVYVTYRPDISPVQHFASSLRRIITSAVIAGLMKKDAVRYRVINNYSVEGLSVTYADNRSDGGGQDVGDISFIDLKAIAPLKRWVIL